MDDEGRDIQGGDTQDRKTEILPAEAEMTQSLMIPPRQELRTLQGGGQRNVDLCDIPHRWFQVLAMHMAGHPYEVICDETGYSAGTISRILHDDRIKILRMQYLELYELEFLQNYPVFNDTIRSLMRSAEPKAQAAGAALFTKHLAFLKKADGPNGPSPQINLSAEEVVFNILNQQG